MKLAETVTFGGGMLDRRADLRGEGQAISVAEPTRFIALWNGKILCNSGGLALLSREELARFQVESDMVYLGQSGDVDFFAQDVSAWTPPEGAPETLGAFSDPSEQVVPFLDGQPGFREIRATMAELSSLDAELSATAKSILAWHISHQFCAKCGARSQNSDGGWRRDCPKCGGQHFPRTDPVVIMLITHENSVLLGRSPGWPEGMYSLLAGFIEPGETMESAVRREVFEESGVRVGRVDYLASQPWPYPSSLMLGCRGNARSTNITLDPNELEDALWVTREEMLAIFSGEHPNIKAPRRGAIAGFILEHWVKDLLD